MTENGSASALLRNSLLRDLLLRGLLARRLRFLHSRLLRRAVHHGFESHAVGVVEEHGVILIVAIIGAGWIGDLHVVLGQERAELVHRRAVGEFERIVMKADIALAVAAPLALRVRGRDPEQRLAVAPAGESAAIVL